MVLFEFAIPTATGTSVAVAALAASHTKSPGILLAFALGAAVGGAVGLGLGALRALFSGIGPRWRWIWPLSGGLCGLVVAIELGAIEKLVGAHARMAVATLLLSPAACASVGTVLALIQPSRGSPAPLALGGPRHWISAAVFGVTAILLARLEVRTEWLTSYPAARQTLVGAAWLVGTAAVVLVLGAIRRDRSRLTFGSVWLALAWLGALGWAFASPAELSAVARSGHGRHVVALVRLATDWDRDGFSDWLRGGDCAPFDAGVHPLAREVPNNGVDEDCSGRDATQPPNLAYVASRAPDTPSTVNVLLVTIDALRPDHTSAYGYSRDTTPNLRRLAMHAVRYDSAYTSGGSTNIALPSLFSGVYPRRLAWRPADIVGNWPPGSERLVLNFVPDDAERYVFHRALRDRGVRTAAVVSRHVGQLVEPLTGRWERLRVASGPLDEDVTGLALEALAEFGEDAFFLWVHYYDPHENPGGGQSVHVGIATYGTSIRDHYDHEVTATDHELGRLLEAVDARPHRPTAVIVAGDHGEAFQGGLQFHGTDVREEAIRIPLLLKAPGLAPGRISTPASLVDIAATVLALTGTPAPAWLDGADLRRLAGERAVITDVWRANDRSVRFLDQTAVTGGSVRLIVDTVAQTRSVVQLGGPGSSLTLLSDEAVPALLTETFMQYDNSTVR